jgi:uncharacterized protein with ATP-grasp and redox domains
MPFQPPPPIRTDTSNAFAHRTVSVRLPGILRETHSLNPDYPDSILAALEHLWLDLENDAPIPPLMLPTPDADEWQPALDAHNGDTWQHSEWFFAETYLYRLVMQAVRFFETGRDPFAPKKAAEVMSESLWQTLDRALETTALPPRERITTLIAHSLWGNRIDLSFAAALAHGQHVEADDLLVDDSELAAEFLLRQPRAVHFVVDNTGTELATDLAFIDGLLDGIAGSVTIHLKAHPTFVSDATLPDLLSFLEIAATERSGAAGAMAQRLQSGFHAGRLRFAPDFYWNSSRFLWDLPPRLARLFTPDTLVVVKGDANYRRMVGDALWQPDLPLAQATAPFPAPLLALRTMKSDPVAGLHSGTTEKLDTEDADWRLDGRRGLIQCTWRG